jgi:hypothetical protein
MAKKDTDPPEALAARDREPTPEGQRASDIQDQIALDAGQVPGPPEGSADIEREITDNIQGTSSAE